LVKGEYLKVDPSRLSFLCINVLLDSISLIKMGSGTKWSLGC
jgi:hypothetical protein